MLQAVISQKWKYIEPVGPPESSPQQNICRSYRSYERKATKTYAIKILLPSPIVFCVVYIPPSLSEGTCLSLLDYLQNLFTSVDVPVFVVGDFNCLDINWQLLSATSTFSSLLCDLIFNLQLTQCVEFPTHARGNILDLIITNSVSRISDVVVHQNLFTSSDHFLISFLALTALPRISRHHPLTFLNYNKADFSVMCDFLTD